MTPDKRRCLALFRSAAGLLMLVAAVAVAVDCAHSKGGAGAKAGADGGPSSSRDDDPDSGADPDDDDGTAPRFCKPARVFCITMDGVSIDTDPGVGPHDSLTIAVVGSREDAVGKTLRLEAATGSLPSWHYFAPPDSGAPSLGTAAVPDGGAPAADGSASAHSGSEPADRRERLLDIHVNDIPDVPSLTITYRMMVGNTIGSGVVLERPLNFAIGKKGYYLEPAIVFPTIFHGERTITTRPQPNGSLATVHADKANLGAMDNMSFGFNVYPWGYPGTRCPRKQYRWAADFIPFVCHPRLLFKPLNFQIGTSITRDAFHQYFLGIGYTLIRGITISGGVAFVKGQFFGPTLFEGQTVPAAFQIPASAIEEKFMMRPYFGVSLSADVLQSALDFLNKAKSVGGTPGDE